VGMAMRNPEALLIEVPMLMRVIMVAIGMSKSQPDRSGI
jgi:hypothetical protein